MNKTIVDDLAILGGCKLFDQARPLGQLDSPPVEEYLALLKTSYDARWLSNDGPLVRQLEKKLCDYHNVRNVIAVANAALGLTMLTNIFSSGRKGEVIMPAFSYRGLPHFVQWAGQMPHFCDIDPITHGLDPKAVERSINKHTTSILAVCNFNSPGQIDELYKVSEEHGIPLFLDSVYGLGSTYKGTLLGGFAKAEVYSAHATKLLNGFEGGYITTNDDELADILRWQRNFTMLGLRPEGISDYGHVLGVNAKLNELHAAMALLSLERLDEVIARNQQRHETYCDRLDAVTGLSILPSLDSESEKRNYQLVVVEVTDDWPFTRDETIRLLRAEGLAIGPYYSPSLHQSEHAPVGMFIPHLPVSEGLSRRFFQLPVGELISIEDICRIGRLLVFLSNNWEQIMKQLKFSGNLGMERK